MVIACLGLLCAETKALNNDAGVGIELGLGPFGQQAPYGAPMGLELYYARALPRGFAAGLSACFTGHFPVDAAFGKSRMILWTGQIAYPITIGLEPYSSLRLTPAAGIGLYHRWFVYESVRHAASRPIVAVRLAADLLLDSGRTLGIAVGGTVFLDNEARFSVTMGERAGLRF